MSNDDKPDGGNKSAKFDPVEAAKIEHPGGHKPAARAKSTASPPKPPVPAHASALDEPPAAPAPKPVPEPQPPVPRAPATTPPQPTSEQVAATRFRVLKDKMVSLHGGTTLLRAGKVIDAAGYGGAPGIATLLAQGVELEPLG